MASNPYQRKDLKSLLRLLSWPVIIGFVLLSMAMALQWIFSLDLNSGFFDRLSYRWLAIAFFVQLLTAFQMIFCWMVNLRLNGLRHIDFRQATVMIGINSIGKYTPGKVLGILARGSALFKMSGDGKLAVQATLVEQIGLIHSGGAVAGLAWFMKNGNDLFALLLLPVIIGSVFAISHSGDLLINVVSRLTRKREMPSEVGPGFKKSYGRVFLMMMVVWGLSAFALYLCLSAYEGRNFSDFWWLLWIIVLAYMAGFLAFFTPAGLGAREGIMLVMLSTQVDTNIALYISIMHRMITLIVDILLGAYALLYGKELLVSS